MNKFFRSALILLSALSILTSCNAKTPPSTSADGTTSAIGAVTTQPPQTTVGDERPETLPETKPETEPAGVSYPKWKEYGDVSLLASIDPSLGFVRALSSHGDLILVSGTYMGPEDDEYTHAYVQTLNSKTGELSAQTELSSPNRVAEFLDNGKVCVYDSINCVAEVYNPDGTKCFTYVSGNTDGTFLLDPSGEGTLWYYTWESAHVIAIPLDGSPLRNYETPLRNGGYLCGCTDGIAYYYAWNDGDECYFLLKTNGEVEYLDVAKGCSFNANCFYYDGEPGYIIDPSKPDGFYSINSDAGIDWVEASDGSRLLMYCFPDSEEEMTGATVMQIIDYRSKEASPQLSVSGGWSVNPYLFTEDALIFVATAYDYNGMVQEAVLCRWEYRHDLQPLNVEWLQYESLQPMVDDAVASIKSQYGVDVIYQPEKIHLVASDYSAAAVTDLQTIYQQLQSLERTLEKYPQGFFDDLCYGDYTHLELFLCGKFTPLTDAGIESAEALANTRGDALVIGFNVNMMNDGYDRVFAHEVMHIMERRIDGIDFDILTQWIYLTPGDYEAYYFSYHDENGDEIWNGENTYYYEDDPEKIYFIDAYSKSYPTEDRARVFEKLMESSGNPYFADCPVLMKKAEFLCTVIRQYFPSVAAVDRAPWELQQ